MATWTLNDVDYIGQCYNPETGTPRMAECFRARLTSNNECRLIDVQMTHLAGAMIDQVLGRHIPSSANDERTELANRAIESFLNLQLSCGWNPAHERSLMLDGSTVVAVISSMQ